METHGYYKDNMELGVHGINILRIISICLAHFENKRLYIEIKQNIFGENKFKKNNICYYEIKPIWKTKELWKFWL